MEAHGDERHLAAAAARGLKEAAIYDAIHPELTNREESRRLERTITDAAKCLPPDAPPTALDIGAGTGFLTSKLLDWGFVVTALELSAAMAARLKRKHAHAVAKGRVRLAIEDADTFLETGVERYSIVAISATLHHLPAPERTLRLAAGRLVPGGSILIFHEPTGATCGRLERAIRAADRLLARAFTIPWDDLDALRRSGLATDGPLCAAYRIVGETQARRIAKDLGLKVTGLERYSAAMTAPARWALRWFVGPSTWSMTLRKPR